MPFHALRDRWKEFARSRRGRRVVRGLRAVLFVGVVCLFVYQFSRIGWRAVWTSLPDEPLFYALLALAYVLFPISESIIYRELRHLDGRTSLAVLSAAFRKRALNQDLLTYSGEAYFYTWPEIT